jgi:hypothetical protein
MACDRNVVSRETPATLLSPGATLFVTWRLFGSLPLKGIAALAAEALERGEDEYRLYERFAWVIMSNQVHLVMRTFRPSPAAMRWIKGSTARSANLLLGRAGQPFWQYESYDHCIRNLDELNRAIRYVETTRLFAIS